MAGAGLHIDMTGIRDIEKRLDALAGFDQRDLLEVIGSTVESQTRRRIADEKTSPDGEQWQDWSEDYAKTRHGGHSLLEGEGDLLDSVDYLVGSGEVEVGSNLIYFATHHFGDEDRGIPQREALGLSDDNEAELDAVIIDWFEEILK